MKISQRIEDDVSAYLATITVVNAVVGLASAVIMWACGVGDPVLWGAVAFLLNYVPILGPMVTSVAFLLAGLLSVETLWLALLPAGLYFAVHIAEGETITPLLLARLFTLNPVLVVVSLVVGAPGQIGLVAWCLWHARRALADDVAGPGQSSPQIRSSVML